MKKVKSRWQFGSHAGSESKRFRDRPLLTKEEGKAGGGGLGGRGRAGE